MRGVLNTSGESSLARPLWPPQESVALYCAEGVYHCVPAPIVGPNCLFVHEFHKNVCSEYTR